LLKWVLLRELAGEIGLLPKGRGKKRGGKKVGREVQVREGGQAPI